MHAGQAYENTSTTSTLPAATAVGWRRDKDIAGLKRLMSKDLTSFLTDIGKEEGKTLDDQIKEIFVKPQAATDESRGEKISGTRATVEYPDEQGKWKTMDFEKEGNDWKMTLPGKDGPPEK